MELTPGVFEVSQSEAERLTSEAVAQGAIVYKIRGDEVVDRASFFEAVRKNLPLSPPIVSDYSWDALSDSIWSGLDELETSRILVVWSNSDRLKVSPINYDIALDVFRDITESIASEELTVGRPKEVNVLLA
jgi:hypothetical protein